MGELLEALHRWKPENFCEAGGGRWKALVGDVWLEFAPSETPGEFEAAEAILERAIAHAVREERWPYRIEWMWDSYGASILRNGEWHITSHLESAWEALGWAAISAAGLEDCALVVGRDARGDTSSAERVAALERAVMGLRAIIEDAASYVPAIQTYAFHRGGPVVEGCPPVSESEAKQYTEELLEALEKTLAERPIRDYLLNTHLYRGYLEDEVRRFAAPAGEGQGDRPAQLAGWVKVVHRDCYRDGVLVTNVPWESDARETYLSIAMKDAVRLDDLIEEGGKLLSERGGEVAVTAWPGGEWRILDRRPDE